jgi:tRNA (cytosine49-C5)-methyltransferase
MASTFFPIEYTEKFSEILQERSGDFFKACATKEPKAIWCNALCTTAEELKSELAGRSFELEPLPFSKNALLIKAGPQRPGEDPAFLEGRFNLQEKASMLPPLALDVRPGQRILDAFAAPGNKTLEICCLAENEAEITALEREPSRIRTLVFNIRKFGMRVDAKKLDFQKFKDNGGFDRILLDAPCSSEGMVRKRQDALKEWSQKKVENMAKRQKKAVTRGFDLLKPGGRMVYSTCSLSPEEDEEVIEHLLAQRPGASVEKVKMPGVTFSKGITRFRQRRYDERVEDCCRLYPHEWDCQPFFFCAISKK